ncbi:MAG: hypothetical protein ACFFB6_09145 [Promethearchaeota archaeon]
MIKCEICGNEYKKRYFKSFILEIRELWGLPQKIIDPIKIKVCYNCGRDGGKILEQFKIKLNNVKKTRELI